MEMVYEGKPLHSHFIWNAAEYTLEKMKCLFYPHHVFSLHCKM